MYVIRTYEWRKCNKKYRKMLNNKIYKFSNLILGTFIDDIIKI